MPMIALALFIIMHKKQSKDDTNLCAHHKAAVKKGPGDNT